MEALDLPRRGRRARRREPVRDPVTPADLVEQHLPAFPEAVGELLAVIRYTSSGAPNRPSASENATDRAAGRALDHPGDHAEARVVIHAGHDPRLTQLPVLVSTSRGPYTMSSCQAPSRQPLPAHIVRRLRRRAAPPPAVAHRIRCTSRATATLRRRRPRISSAGSAAHPSAVIARSSHTRASSPPTPVRARPRPSRPSANPANPAARYLATHAVHRLARHARLRGHLAHPRAVHHRHHRPIPLLDNRQRHQRQSRPPAQKRKSRSRPARQAVLTLLSSSPETGQQTRVPCDEFPYVVFKGGTPWRSSGRTRSALSAASSCRHPTCPGSFAGPCRQATPLRGGLSDGYPADHSPPAPSWSGKHWASARWHRQGRARSVASTRQGGFDGARTCRVV